MITGLTMTCDVCQVPAYTAHSVCRECGGDFCPAHILPSSLDEGAGTGLCFGCVASAAQDTRELTRMFRIASVSLEWAQGFREAVR